MLDRGLALTQTRVEREFSASQLMGRVGEWLGNNDFLHRLAELGGAPEGLNHRVQLEAYAYKGVKEILSDELALDRNSDALRERWGEDALSALEVRGLHGAAGRTFVRLEAILSGRDATGLALEKAADPNQLVLTRKEEQYLRLAQEGRFDVLDPQFGDDPYFLPYRDLWYELSSETRQAIIDGQKLWTKVATYWGQVLNGQRPDGPQPVDWWGVRGAALEHVEQRAHQELAALEQGLQSGQASPDPIGELLQRLDVYRKALGADRFDRLLERVVSQETRDLLQFRDEFVKGKKTYWHMVIADGKEAADRWDAEHYQPLREYRDTMLKHPTFAPLAQAIQNEAVAIHNAYADLWRAKEGWWQAYLNGESTDKWAAQGQDARERLARLDPEAAALWGPERTWHLDGEYRAEAERRARERQQGWQPALLPPPPRVTDRSWVKTDAAYPIQSLIQAEAGRWNREWYEAILDQFDVVNQERYRPGRNQTTYCNIYVWDVTRAMGVEIAHWINTETGQIARADEIREAYKRGYPGSTGKYRELDANGMTRWLREQGQEYGWVRVTAEQAQAAANLGIPAIAALEKPGGIGHMAMVRPGEYHPTLGPTIAQAGSRNFTTGTAAEGFGQNNLHRVEYYIYQGPEMQPRGYSDQEIHQRYLAATSDRERFEILKPLFLEAERESGIPWEIHAAQWALESNWGKATPKDVETGKESYNMFGIKGTSKPGTNGVVMSWTWEEIDGRSVRVLAPFRAYNTVVDSIRDHTAVLNLPRYDAARQCNGDLACVAHALRAGGYATDSRYPQKLLDVIETFKRW